MTLLITQEEVREHASPAMALAAMERAFKMEADGLATLPRRIDTRTPAGFIRCMPARLGEVMGLKVMTLVQGRGTRYTVHLYSALTGELLAILDADELTRLRTAATTAYAARLMVPVPPESLGLLGSGFEAVGQLRALSGIWKLSAVTVYSPTPGRRERFAREMSEELGIPVKAAASAKDVVAGDQVLVLATKATEPVLDGNHLRRGAVVFSIGATRLDLRELDVITVARSGTVVGDDPPQLESESGDIAEAIRSGVLEAARVVGLAALSRDHSLLRTDADHDLLLLKTVGTALQDLALAEAIWEDARVRGYGTPGPELAALKPFAVTPDEDLAGLTQ